MIDMESFKVEGYILQPVYSQVSTIHYTLNREARITLTAQTPDQSVFATLIDNVLQSAGTPSLEWDGKNSVGEIASQNGPHQLHLRAMDPVTGEVMVRKGVVTINR